MVHKPVAWTLSGNLLEIQILISYPKPMEIQSEGEAQKSILMILASDSNLLKSLKITDI